MLSFSSSAHLPSLRHVPPLCVVAVAKKVKDDGILLNVIEAVPRLALEGVCIYIVCQTA